MEVLAIVNGFCVQIPQEHISFIVREINKPSGLSEVRLGCLLTFLEASQKVGGFGEFRSLCLTIEYEGFTVDTPKHLTFEPWQTCTIAFIVGQQCNVFLNNSQTQLYQKNNEYDNDFFYTSSLQKQLLSLHPVLQSCFDKGFFADDFFISGGAIIESFIRISRLTPLVKERGPFDIDIFCLPSAENKIEKFLKECEPYKPKAFIRNGSIITILTEGLPNLQITRCQELDWEYVLEKFDMSCCQIMFGDDFHTTKDFSNCIENGWKCEADNVPEDRVTKYLNRGITFSKVTTTEPLNQKYLAWKENDGVLLKDFQDISSTYQALTFPLPPLKYNWIDEYTRKEKRSFSIVSRDAKPWSKAINVNGWNLLHPDDLEVVTIRVGLRKVEDREPHIETDEETKKFLIERANTIAERFASRCNIDLDLLSDSAEYLQFLCNTNKITNEESFWNIQICHKVTDFDGIFLGKRIYFSSLVLSMTPA